MLRDEAIYIAHKAAHPQEYPTRAGVLRDGRRQKENAEKFTEPTKVHLQVFDGKSHGPTTRFYPGIVKLILILLWY